MSDSDDDAGASRPAREKFLRERWWFIRQIVVARPHPLAASVAVVLADHANRETGLMYPSQTTVAEILKVSVRYVRECEAAMVDQGHLVCVGRGPGHVKAFRWNLTDRRVEHRFDQTALGMAESGTVVPLSDDNSSAGNRNPSSGSKARSEPKPELARRQTGTVASSNRNPGSDEPTSEPESEPATTSSPPTEGLEGEDQKIVEEIARVHGYAPAPKVLDRWRGNLVTARIRAIDPRRDLLAAVREALVDESTQGRDRLATTTDLLGRFETPARKLAAIWKTLPAHAVERFLENLEKHANAVITSRPKAPAPPKPPTKQFSLRERDARRHRKRLILQAGGWPMALSTKAAWLVAESEELKTRGIAFDLQLAAIARARAEGRAPSDLGELKKRGGLRGLVERQLEWQAHAPAPFEHPPPTTMN